LVAVSSPEEPPVTFAISPQISIWFDPLSDYSTAIAAARVFIRIVDGCKFVV
jgi:hypothetical protein